MRGLIKRIGTIGMVALGVAMAGAASGADEDPYPSRPVSLIVPFGPGGASDFVARIIQPRFSELLKQSVVIVNRAGAAGNIGLTSVARAKGDGYTVFLGNIGTMAVNPSVYGDRLPVNTLKDLMPVTLLAEAPDLLVASPAFPPNTAQEFVEYARARPGKVDFASPGAGSVNRLEMELFASSAKLQLMHIPYKGGAGDAIAALLGNQVPVMFTSMASAVGQVQGKTLKALAVTSARRAPHLPNVPTLAEQGFPDLVASSWQAVYVPAGTPAPVIAKLYDALKATMADPDVIARLAKGGVDVRVSASPQDLAAFTEAELKRWSAVVKSVGVTAD